MKPTEFKTKTGGTVRFMLDCMPKTQEERKTREQAVWRTCCEVLANSVSVYGVEETLNRMKNGPHAGLIPGRA